MAFKGQRMTSTARMALLDLLCVLVILHIIHIQDRISLEASAARARAHMHMHMTTHLYGAISPVHLYP